MGGGVSMSKGWVREAKDFQVAQAGPFCIIKRPGAVFGSNFFVVWSTCGLFVKFSSHERATAFLAQVVTPILIPLLEGLNPGNIDFVLGMTKIANKKQYSPLHVAVKANASNIEGFTHTISALLNFVNQPNRDGFTPVHFASASPTTLALVLQARSPLPNVNITAKEGVAPIHCASAASADCVRLLLQHQALIGVVDKLGQNPLHFAALAGKGDCITLLTQAMGPAAGTFINQKTLMDGNTPLHCAMLSGHRAAMVALMHSGANPNLYNSSKDTPLHIGVAGKVSPEMLADFITLSLQLPSPLTLNVLMGNKQSQTVLHLAALKGMPAHVHEILLRAHPALVNMVNKDGETALHIAASESGESHLAVVQMLLATRNVFVNAQCARDQQTPLHKLAGGPHGNLQICEELLRARADVNARDNKGRTPMHLAGSCKPPRIKLIELFVRHGGWATALDHAGVRPVDFLPPVDRDRLGAAAQAQGPQVAKQILTSDTKRCEQRHLAEIAEQQRLEADHRSLPPFRQPLPPHLQPQPLFFEQAFFEPPPYHEPRVEDVSVAPPPGSAPPAPVGAAYLPPPPLANPVPPAASVSIHTPTSHDETKTEEGKECVICLSGPRNAVFVPCGHAMFCHPCASALFDKKAPCPCCNGPIQMAVKLYQ